MKRHKYTIIAALLLVPLLISALALVSNQNRYRQLFIQFDHEQALARKMDVEYAQLELEQSTLGKQIRIAAKAKDELGMVPVTHARTEYLELNKK